MTYDTEAHHQDNKIIQGMTEKLYKLRGIECQKCDMNKKYNKAKPLLSSVTKDLLKHLNFVVHRTLWEELHDRMVYYYTWQNEKSRSKRIPFFRNTLHNEVVPEWLSVKKKIKGPLLHFDTHDDMDIVENAKNKCLSQKEIKKGACGFINHPVTCMLWTKNVDKVIWCMPKWVYDNDACYDQVLAIKGKDMRYLRSSEQKKDKFLCVGTTEIVKDINFESYNFSHPFVFCRQHTQTQKQWDKLSTKIEKYYILDIDLDFFSCNGEKVSKTVYMRDFTDLCSTGRVSGLPPLINPREERRSKQGADIIKDLEKEAKMIQKRVQVFINGIKYLKRKGKIPCIINISDSAASFFSGKTKRAVVTNSYCPKYFVPYIHSLLIPELLKISN
jgi:hypothetical protein